MLSLIALITVLSVVAVLLYGRVGPIVALTLIPLVAALLAGFNFQEISLFFNDGLLKVMSISTMFIFAILYFGLMQDIGLFETIINKMLSLTQGNITAIIITTVIIAAVAHLDGSGASTFLISIPALLPLYKRLKMSPYLLILLIGLSASIMNMLPWAGPLGRVATVLEMDPVKLWLPLIPVQGIAFLLLIAFAYFLSRREKKIIRHLPEQSLTPHQDFYNADIQQTAVTRRSTLYLWVNGLLTLGIIALLMSSIIPPALVFMIGVSVALSINFPSQKEQFERIKAHAPGAIIMATIIFAAGIFLGVLKGSNMLTALAESIVQIMPSIFVPYLHLIIGFFGVPLELILNTDAYYFALLPVIEQITTTQGVPSLSVAYAMIIGNILGTFISPFSPALWLALGLARLEMGEYIRYAFFWVWGFSAIVFLCAWLMGII